MRSSCHTAPFRLWGRDFGGMQGCAKRGRELRAVRDMEPDAVKIGHAAQHVVALVYLGEAARADDVPDIAKAGREDRDGADGLEDHIDDAERDVLTLSLIHISEP